MARLRLCAIWAAMLATMSAGALAQARDGVGVPQPKAPPLPQGSVTGHIFCADTRTPARGAHVMLFPLPPEDAKGAEPFFGQPLIGITALDGSFAISHVPPNEYVVVALAAGYLSPIDGMMIPVNENNPSADTFKRLREAAPLVKVSGSNTASIDVELQRGAALSGKVVYSDGSPAGQLSLQIEPADLKKTDQKAPRLIDTGAMFRTVMMQQTRQTDDLGHFRLAGIPPGSYVLSVAQSFETISMQQRMIATFNPEMAGKETKLVIYSGSTLHRKDATVYQVKAGDVVDGIEIRLPLSGLHSVMGKVAGKDGAAVATAELELTDGSDPTITFHAVIKAGGEFRFAAVPEGTYTLKVTGGKIYNRDIPEDFPREAIENDSEFKPVRVFADSSVGVVVQTTDVENLMVSLAEMKQTDTPKGPASPDPDPL
jgi:hypothetical protein